MLAGGELFFGGRTPAKPKWSEVMIFWMISSGREASSQRRTLAGEENCASYRNSGERLFAGGRRFTGSRTPAKPKWSEVIFLDDYLRQEAPYRRRAIVGEKGCASDLSSGEATLVIGRLWFCSSVFYYNCILVAFMLSLVKSKE